MIHKILVRGTTPPWWIPWHSASRRWPLLVPFVSHFIARLGTVHLPVRSASFHIRADFWPDAPKSPEKKKAYSPGIHTRTATYNTLFVLCTGSSLHNKVLVTWTVRRCIVQVEWVMITEVVLSISLTLIDSLRMTSQKLFFWYLFMVSYGRVNYSANRSLCCLYYHLLYEATFFLVYSRRRWKAHTHSRRRWKAEAKQRPAQRGRPTRKPRRSRSERGGKKMMVLL